MKQAKTQKRYSPELKERSVRLVMQLRAETGEKHGSVKRVAEQLDVGVESLRSRLTQAEIDHGDRAGTTTAGQHRGTEAVAPGDTRVEADQRDPPIGVSFFRGGSRPPTEVMIAFIDADADPDGVVGRQPQGVRRPQAVESSSPCGP